MRECRYLFAVDTPAISLVHDVSLSCHMYTVGVDLAGIFVGADDFLEFVCVHLQCSQMSARFRIASIAFLLGRPELYPRSLYEGSVALQFRRSALRCVEEHCGKGKEPTSKFGEVAHVLSPATLKMAALSTLPVPTRLQAALASDFLDQSVVMDRTLYRRTLR